MNQVGAVQARMEEKKEDKEKKGTLDHLFDNGMALAKLQQFSQMLPDQKPDMGGYQTDPSTNYAIMRRISRTA